MSTTRSLRAKLTANDGIGRTLENISDKAEEASKSFSGLSTRALDAGVSLNTASRKAEKLSDKLDDVVEDSTATTGALEAVEHSVDDTGDEFSEAAKKAQAYQSSLGDADNIAAFVAENEAAASSIDEVGDEASESTRELLGYQAALTSLSSLSLPSLGDREASVDVDGLDKVKRHTSDIDALSGKREIEIETAIEGSDSLDEFASSIDVASTKALKEEIDELGDESSETSGKLSSAIAAVESWTTSQIAASKATREHRQEVDELGDEYSDLSAKAAAARIATPNFGGGSLAGGTRDVDDGGIDLAYSLPSLPDMPDVDFGGISKGFGSVSDTATDASNSVKEVALGIGQVLGLAKNAGGLSRIAGALGGISSAGGALAGLAIWGIIGTALGGLVSLAGALGGIITGIVGLTAAVGGLLAVGLFKKGEEIAQSSQKIEGAMEGIQKYVKSFQDDVRLAVQPLFELEGLGNFLEGFIQGGLSVLEDFSTMVAQLWPAIQEMFSGLGSDWSSTQPEFFMELEKTIRAFMPMIEGFISDMIKAAPGILNFMRTAGTKLLPKLADMFEAIWDNITPFIPAGMAAVELFAELTTLFFRLMQPISEILSYVLTPFFQGLAWGVGLITDMVTPAVQAFSAFADWLNKWLGAMWNALTSLDVVSFGAMAYNMMIEVFEFIADGLKMGISGLYSMAIGLIKRFPGAKQAIKARNAISKIRGKGKAIPDKLNLGKTDLSSDKMDIYPDRKGKQTSPGQPGEGKGQGKSPYENNDKPVEQHFHVSGDNNERKIARLAREELEKAQKQGRRRTSSSN